MPRFKKPTTNVILFSSHRESTSVTFLFFGNTMTFPKKDSEETTWKAQQARKRQRNSNGDGTTTTTTSETGTTMKEARDAYGPFIYFLLPLFDK